MLPIAMPVPVWQYNMAIDVTRTLSFSLTAARVTCYLVIHLSTYRAAVLASSSSMLAS